MATGKKWEELDIKIHDSTLQTLKSLSFYQMTPVQQATIPLFLSYKDVVVEVKG